MTEKERYMISGMDRLLRKFNKYPDDKEFTVEEIIKASNDVYKEIWYYGTPYNSYLLLQTQMCL